MTDTLSPWALLVRWWRVGRHLAALARAGYAVVPADRLAECHSITAAVVRWSERSGALNDGRAREPRRKVRGALRLLCAAFPEEVSQ